MLKKSKNTGSSVAPFSMAHSSGGQTMVGQQISIEGKIKGNEDLVIEGSVKGSIELEGQHLTVGAKGQVEADIYADSVTISGTLVGNITAVDKVTITKDADFNGEIKAKRISVEDGAMLKAVIELERESQIKAVPIGKQAGQEDSGKEDTPLTLGQ